MNEDIQRKQAMMLVDRAYRHQMKGEYADAIILYKRSISVLPTAEAYTFLGWTYSMLNRYDEAISSCKEAIETDPDLGNPYNDIGSYLIELGRWEKATSWLAISATRFETPHFAFLNLGRVNEHQGRYRAALQYYNKAIDLDPYYRAAIRAKFDLLAKMN